MSELRQDRQVYGICRLSSFIVHVKSGLCTMRSLLSQQSINQSISDLYNGAIIRREAASRRRRDESRDQLKATENR